MMMLAKMAAMLVGGAAAGPAAPVFVAAEHANRSSGTSAISVTKPAGTLDAHKLYAFVWQVSNAGAAATISGWTQELHYNASSAGASAGTLTILSRTASSEGSSYSVAASTSGAVTVQILTYSGGLGLIDVIGARDVGNSTFAIATALTATALGTLLLAFFKSTSGTIATPPSGKTLRDEASSPWAPTAAVYELSPSPAGLTTADSLTWNAGAVAIGLQVQIK